MIIVKVDRKSFIFIDLPKLINTLPFGTNIRRFGKISTMASNGQVPFSKIVAGLAEKAGTKCIIGHDTQQQGRYFWSMIEDDMKDQLRNQNGKGAFWQFASHWKTSLINNDFEEINSLYHSFNENALNYFENIFSNYVKKHVDAIY